MSSMMERHEVLGRRERILNLVFRWTVIIVALLFALVNSVVGPVLRLLSLPFVLLTLGLFLLVGMVMFLTRKIDWYGTAEIKE